MSERITLAFRWREMLAMLVGVLLYGGISYRSSCVVALVKVSNVQKKKGVVYDLLS